MKQTKQTPILWIAILMVVLSACTTQNTFEQPLAPTMGFPTATLPATLGEESPEQPMGETLPTMEVPTVESTPTPDGKTCGQSGSITILIIGADKMGSSAPNGADAIRLIKSDFDTQRVIIITFPRDLLVQTASMNTAAQVQQKLGLTFYDAYQAASGTALEKNAVAASVVAQLMQTNFGVQPQHYLTLQMDQFATLVDTIGGVEITISEAFVTERNVSFAAGTQTLNGTQALEYASALNPGGEAARNTRQNNLLIALQKEMFSLETLTQIPSLLTQFQGAMVTDLSLEQLTSLSCLATTMPKENIVFGAITSPDLMTNNVPDIAKVKTYLSTLLGD